MNNLLGISGKTKERRCSNGRAERARPGPWQDDETDPRHKSHAVATRTPPNTSAKQKSDVIPSRSAAKARDLLAQTSVVLPPPQKTFRLGALP